MSTSAEFAEFLKEQLKGFGPVTMRRMFGGSGVYRDGLIFAIVIGDVLYLKADDVSRGEFTAEGLGPFVYDTKHGSKSVMSYLRAPERCLDDPDEMVAWARKAYEAALRQRKPERKAKRR